jgi:hypothetical protein
MSEIKLERELCRWAAIKPESIASSSPAAVTYFAADAQKDISALAAALAVKDAEIARLREALAECEKHFDNIADADHDQDGLIPNKEMQLLVMVRASLKGSSL